MGILVEKSMSTDWLSNTWLVADKPGGHAVLVDTGGPPEPILARVEELGVRVTHALCTHHHIDHVAHSSMYKDRLGSSVVGHSAEESLFDFLDITLAHNEVLTTGGLTIQALHIPGHTLGQLAFVINDVNVFTGDTLFKGSVGGTRAPGHTTFEDIHQSIMQVLMKLPLETAVYPGHMDPTTIGSEWETNPFIRMWRGLDPEGTGRCIAMGEPAVLLLRGPDYDGGTKCQVRFDAASRLDIVPGSMTKDA